jgi:hypothetical protein
VIAAGFETGEEPFRQMVTPGTLRLPGVRCYLGDVGGHPVTTGIGVTLGAFVGIFNVATPPAQRRRGYGAAVTARAVTDGLAAGAAWSWLQSSPSGYQVYEHLGFQRSNFAYLAFRGLTVSAPVKTNRCARTALCMFAVARCRPGGAAQIGLFCGTPGWARP